jgi:L-asparaginase II
MQKELTDLQPVLVRKTAEVEEMLIVLAKDGAEAVYGVGLGDGRALALKIEDGADRARIVVAMSILQKVMGVVSQEVEHQLDSQELFGGGVQVGKVIPAFSV